MIDIAELGDDFTMVDTNVKRAENILSVQLASLVYAPEFGIDFKYFIDERFEFQNESFKAYLVRRLSDFGIDVTSVITLVEALYEKYTFNLAPTEQGDGFVK